MIILYFLQIIFNTYLIDKPENKVQIPENLCDNAGEFVTNTRAPAQNSVSSGVSPSFLFVMIWHDLTVGIWALFYLTVSKTEDSVRMKQACINLWILNCLVWWRKLLLTVLLKHQTSYRKNKNHDQNVVLQIGPHFELDEVKQMKNINNLNINCCKSSSGKVNVSIWI